MLRCRWIVTGLLLFLWGLFSRRLRVASYIAMLELMDAVERGELRKRPNRHGFIV